MTEGIELPNHEKSERSENRKLTNTWEYCKRTLLNICGDERQNLKKNASRERENYSKPNYFAETSSK